MRKTTGETDLAAVATLRLPRRTLRDHFDAHQNDMRQRRQAGVE